MYAPIRIIIADDHEIFRIGFKVLLEKQFELELVGEAENGAQLIEMVDMHKPDIVITDIKMPILTGIEAARIIKQKYPGLGIIALSMFNDEDVVVEMLEAGARGYILKDTNKDEVITAAKEVMRGGSFYCPSTSVKLSKMIAESKFNPYRCIQKTNFTSREMDIIRLVCEQYSNKEIADRLHLSKRTVENYREKIQDKTGAKNGVGIAMYAFKNKLYSF